MNAPMTKFAIMRANREKQRQIAAYGRVMASIDRAVLGLPEKVRRPMIPADFGKTYTAADAKAAVASMRPLLKDWKS